MKALPIIFAIMMLTACGTTSSINQNGEPASELDFSMYESVIVTDFGDGTKKQNLPTYAGTNFADRIVSSIRAKGVFETVTKNKSEVSGKALIIGGDITRYVEGNAALKVIVGFGAGNTYFDALVKLSDHDSQQDLGEIKVDKNSWGLGGGLAASQTVEQFMNGAAEKIAEELVKAKNYSVPN